MSKKQAGSQGENILDPESLHGGTESERLDCNKC